MLHEQFVQNLRTLESLYTQVFLLSSYKGQIICNKDFKVSLRIETETIITGLPLMQLEKKLLIEFLTDLIFLKINQIKTIENEIHSFL